MNFHLFDCTGDEFSIVYPSGSGSKHQWNNDKPCVYLYIHGYTWYCISGLALPTRNCRFLLGMMDFPQAVPAPAETKPAKKTIVETATVRFEKRPFGMAPAKEDGCYRWSNGVSKVWGLFKHIGERMILNVCKQFAKWHGQEYDIGLFTNEV